VHKRRAARHPDLQARRVVRLLLTDRRRRRRRGGHNGHRRRGTASRDGGGGDVGVAALAESLLARRLFGASALVGLDLLLYAGASGELVGLLCERNMYVSTEDFTSQS